MSIKFFGEFLLERGAVDRVALLEALALQAKQNLRLGTFAVSRGYLDEPAADRVHSAQRGTDLRFGEMAVSLGLLSRKQVLELLAMQTNDHILLGDALVELGHVDRAALEAEIAAFEEDQRRYATDEVLFPDGVEGGEHLAVPVDLMAKLLGRLAGIGAKLGEGEVTTVPPVDALFPVTVSFRGAMTVDFTLCASADVAEQVAMGSLGEDVLLREPELLLDPLEELVNVVCGNAAAIVARRGLSVEVSPPRRGLPAREPGEPWIVFWFHVPEGALELRLLVRNEPPPADPA